MGIYKMEKNLIFSLYLANFLFFTTYIYKEYDMKEERKKKVIININTHKIIKNKNKIIKYIKNNLKTKKKYL